jgi:hypothetical protein
MGDKDMNHVGKQDWGLLVNPETTFWRKSYKRHTPFGVELKEHISTNSSFFKLGSGKQSFQIIRSADLMRKMYLRIELPRLHHDFLYTEDVARALFEHLSINFNNTDMQKIEGEFSHVYHQLTTKSDVDVPHLTGQSDGTAEGREAISNANPSVLWYDLPFYFGATTYNAFPSLCAFNQQIFFHYQLRNWKDIVVMSPKNGALTDADGEYDTDDDGNYKYETALGVAIPKDTVVKYFDASGNLQTGGIPTSPEFNIRLFIDWVYLSDEERLTFLSAQTQSMSATNATRLLGAGSELVSDGGLEYLIQQSTKIQISPSNILPRAVRTATVSLEVHHPVKEFIFMFRPVSATSTELKKGYFKFYDGPVARPDLGVFKTLKMTHNNQDRFQPLDSHYFRYLQPKEYHTRVPKDSVFVWSLAKDPESSDPTGSLNYSVIDQVRWTFEFSEALPEDMELIIYSVHWNTNEFNKQGQVLIRWAN